MKLLFVANRVPYPPFRGDKLKIFNLGKQLQNQHEIHLIAIAETAADLEYREELEKVFHKVTFLQIPKWKSFFNVIFGILGSKPLQVAYFKSRKFNNLLHQQIARENYDAVHVQHLRMAQFFSKANKSRVILDLPDAFSLYWKRRSENATSLWKRKFANFEYQRLLKFEKITLPNFPLNLVCSKEDCNYLIENTQANIQVLPNGVDIDTFGPKAEVSIEHSRILFTGNMDYEPNVDAVVYFVEEIFPEILKEIPNAIFVIAGQRPVNKVKNLAANNIFITGFVQDISVEYAKSNVVVAPLRFGAGTQNKVLEAMAVGVPVVCTEIGFKGLEIHSGEGAILAKTKADFIAEVVRLLREKEYRNSVSLNGRNVIVNNFSWQAIAQKLSNYFLEITK